MRKKRRRCPLGRMRPKKTNAGDDPKDRRKIRHKRLFSTNGTNTHTKRKRRTEGESADGSISSTKGYSGSLATWPKRPRAPAMAMAEAKVKILPTRAVHFSSQKVANQIESSKAESGSEREGERESKEGPEGARTYFPIKYYNLNCNSSQSASSSCPVRANSRIR